MPVERSDLRNVLALSLVAAAVMDASSAQASLQLVDDNA
jgi:hypothetical protein